MSGVRRTAAFVRPEQYQRQRRPISTCAIYGIPEKIPIPQEHSQRPINPYGFSKLLVERMLTDVGHACGLRSVALRYFNAAGADSEDDIGAAP
jgi:UDP-glucose 4-epimerase